MYLHIPAQNRQRAQHKAVKDYLKDATIAGFGKKEYLIDSCSWFRRSYAWTLSLNNRSLRLIKQLHLHDLVHYQFTSANTSLTLKFFNSLATANIWLLFYRKPTDRT